MSKFMNAVKNSDKVEKAPAKKKNTGPVITPSDAIRESVDELVSAKKNFAVAKADIAALEPEIISAAREIQEADALKGNFRKSYDVRGHDSTIKFVSANKFSIAEDDVKELKELLADEYDNMVKEDIKVSLKAEVFADDNLSDELMDLLGDNFQKFFETTIKHSVREDFDKKLFSLSADVREDVKDIAKQAKPALK